MKKHVKYVPLEISGSELEAFVNNLRDKLYQEFWPETEENSRKEEIKSRIEKNVYAVLESSLK
ncbi:MAG: hypothetical protein JSU85_05870 [Candidatus Zixiibacteriota bacterium]|nr:MAG: hypothetical protein JSU85_05870 [candidate division Zixibacteria bacterium]